MNTHPFFLVIAIMLATAFLAGPISAARITISNGQVTGAGEETTVHIVLDEAPRGLAGYFLNVSFDPAVARITHVDYPSWAVMKGTSGLKGGGDVELKALDAEKAIQAGAKNIELATITVQGQKPGSTYLHLHNDVVDGDTGGAIPRTLIDGSFTVGNAQPVTYVPTQAPADPDVGADNPEPVSVPDAPVQPTTKVTYAASGALVPVMGIILGIFGAGGYLRRRQEEK